MILKILKAYQNNTEAQITPLSVKGLTWRKIRLAIESVENWKYAAVIGGNNCKDFVMHIESVCNGDIIGMSGN